MTEADFSIISMFMGADIIVKAVMISLIIASIWCWGIMFSKLLSFRRIIRSSNMFESEFWSNKTEKQLYNELTEEKINPMSTVFLAAIEEYDRIRTEYTGSEMQARLERAMTVTANREIDEMQSQISFLATIGSTAPFIGLFGTVWGIMHSFQGIAAMQSTNLAVVAPGIAEALLATALGLVAAIPAVMGYNKLTNEIDRYDLRLETFIQELGSRLSYKKTKKEPKKV